MRVVALGLVLLTLTGCASTGSDGPATLSVQETKTAIAAGRSKGWKDPDSLRDARIGVVNACMGAWQAATCACVEVNGRNSFGGYTGLKQYMVTVVNADRSIADVRDAHFTDQLTKCDKLAPFPELNGGGQAPASPQKRS